MVTVGPVVEHLEVNPYGGDTVATLVLVREDLTTVIGTPTSTDRQDWTATVTYDQPGLWLRRWTVTGAGYGFREDEIAVAPTVWDLGPGAVVYATTADLARYLGGAPPLGARRLLHRASELVDEALLCAVYDTDAAELPTDPKVAQALARATCAQVRWWGETGDETGALAQFQSVSMSGVSLSRGSQARGNAIPAQRLCADARMFLANAGLTGQGPITDRDG